MNHSIEFVRCDVQVVQCRAFELFVAFPNLFSQLDPL